MGTRENAFLPRLNRIFGRASHSNLPFQKGLLFHGGRQRHQLARLPLLGITARGIHCRKSLESLEINRSLYKPIPVGSFSVRCKIEITI